MDNRVWSPRPKANCPVCNGVGFIYGNVPVDHPMHGRAIPCPGEGCLEYQWKYRHEIRYKLDKEFGKPHTFETFEIWCHAARQCFEAAKKFANGEFLWLLLYGGTGNGKTHLLHAIRAEMSKNGKGIWYQNVSDWYNDYLIAVKNSMGPEFIQHFQKKVDVLLLDDWRPESSNDTLNSRLEEVLCAREGKPTALTTNRDISELPERLQSRFKDRSMSLIIYNKASDYRLKLTKTKEEYND